MKQRDIVLLPFPFSDQTGLKVRPAIIISNDHFNKASEDLIVCAITSVIDKSKHSVLLDQKDIETGYLHQQSSIKVENILKIKKSIILKTIATVNKNVLTKVLDVLQKIVDPNQ